jgi:hypothetical protein
VTAHAKMSEIMKELALRCFRNPEAVPSSEAAHAALLFAHVAWNRTLGLDTQDYKGVLKAFLRSNPNLWSEFRSPNAETLIEMLRQAKEERFLADRRVIIVCGMREENVHVEWCKEEDYPRASELAKTHLNAEFGTGRTHGKRHTQERAKRLRSAISQFFRQ